VAAVLLLGCSLGAGAQKARYSSSGVSADEYNYPLMVHVVGSRLESFPAGGGLTTSVLHLNVVVDGQKLELATDAGALLHPGDYRARMVVNDEKKSGWFSRSYELLFGDRTHVVFRVVGETE
jgi:hypothetical protein